eukprot:g8752.t1
MTSVQRNSSTAISTALSTATPSVGIGVVRGDDGGGNSEVSRFRVYEQWEGNEQFFCGGRLVAGPNWKSLFFTALLIVVPLILYLVFVGRFLINQSHFSIPLVSLILGVLSLIFLFITGCMDPGILPRQVPDEEYLADRKAKSIEVPVNGQSVTVRYNETCHFYQPPRAHHCSVNDNCIEKFDHHCPWVGTTIGLRNYRFFLSFIFTASLLCLYVIATGIAAIKLAHDDLETDDSKVAEAIEEVPAAVAVSIYCILGFLFVGGLSIFHIYLVSTNQTTYENFRSTYNRSENPYNQGCFRNCWSVWCVPIPKGKVKFRSYAMVKNQSNLAGSSQRSQNRSELRQNQETGPVYLSTSSLNLTSERNRSTIDALLVPEQLSQRNASFQRQAPVNPLPAMSSPVTELMQIQVIGDSDVQPTQQHDQGNEEQRRQSDDSLGPNLGPRNEGLVETRSRNRRFATDLSSHLTIFEEDSNRRSL